MNPIRILIIDDHPLIRLGVRHSVESLSDLTVSQECADLASVHEWLHNGGKADQSASSAQKLITQQNVVAIIGPNASRYALPAAEIAETSKVILITPWSTAPKATLDSRTGASKKYVFRACFIDPFQGRVLAKFALDNLKLTKAAVLYDVASEYNKGIAEFFKKRLIFGRNPNRISG